MASRTLKTRDGEAWCTRLHASCKYTRLQSSDSHFIQTQTNTMSRTSLVALWIRRHLPVQGCWFQSLVREDATCRGATKPRARKD